MTPIENLNALAQLRTKLNEVNALEEITVKNALPAEVVEKIDKIQAKFEKVRTALTTQVTQLEARIKDDVKKLGFTVKGAELMATFNKGRVSWNDDKLTSYAADHPEIKEFRKVGEPSVSIRAIKTESGNGNEIVI